MGKHKKVQAISPPPSDPDADSDSPLADVEAGLRVAFNACLDMIKTGDSAVQVLREIGGLGRAITTVQAERRAQKKARQYTAKNLPKELVIEHLRLISEEERAHVMRELESMRDTDSVLG